MKVMLDPKQATKAQVLRFVEEAQITGQLEHPGIVPIYELGVDGSGNVFYTMKLISGTTLKDILKKISDGSKVTATVKCHGRAKKVEIIKFRRRKHHMKRMGHRQNYTEVEITGIS